MATLPSGLEEIAADDEDLARYLTSSSQFNAIMVKPAAFLPNPKDHETSVFRHGSEPRDRLWATLATNMLPANATYMVWPFAKRSMSEKLNLRSWRRNRLHGMPL
jgi:hypothetical protein